MFGKCTQCDSENICEETSKCMFHCVEKNHFHCSRFECDSIIKCDFSKSFKCEKHCEDVNHSHCINSHCDSKKFCRKNNFSQCVLHCRDLFHSHCINYNCKNKTFQPTCDVCDESD